MLLHVHLIESKGVMEKQQMKSSLLPWTQLSLGIVLKIIALPWQGEEGEGRMSYITRISLFYMCENLIKIHLV